MTPLVDDINISNHYHWINDVFENYILIHFSKGRMCYISVIFTPTTICQLHFQLLFTNITIDSTIDKCSHIFPHVFSTLRHKWNPLSILSCPLPTKYLHRQSWCQCKSSFKVSQNHRSPFTPFSHFNSHHFSWGLPQPSGFQCVFSSEWEHVGLKGMGIIGSTHMSHEYRHHRQCSISMG